MLSSNIVQAFQLFAREPRKHIDMQNIKHVNITLVETKLRILEIETVY